MGRWELFFFVRTLSIRIFCLMMIMGEFNEKRATVETRIKEPVFIRTLRLKSNLLNPLNKNPPEAETRRDSYIRVFMCSEFLRIFKNSCILITILQLYKRRHDFLTRS